MTILIMYGINVSTSRVTELFPNVFLEYFLHIILMGKS
jgi:hypothetical protein